MIWLRAETPSTSHPLPSSTPPSGTPPLLPIPLPTPSPPLLLPSTVCRAGVSEVTLLPRKRLCITLGPRYEVGKSSSAPVARLTRGYRSDYGFVAILDDEIRRDPERDVGYGITDTWDEMLVGMPGAPTTDDTELSRRMTDFVTMVRQYTDEIYGRLDDAQDDRLLMSCRLNMLYKDRRAHARTARLMEAKTQVTTLQSQLGPASGPTRPEISEEAENSTKKSHKVNTSHNNHHHIYHQNAQLKALIDQGVADALAARDADRIMNGDDNHNSGTGVRRQAPPARKCTYPNFMKCKPLYFKGTEGVVELTQWFERMETMFCISNCFVENQIKFSTCTLLGSDLTRWNSHVKTVGHVAYAMTWTNLKNKMTDKYCLRGEIKKLEAEMWNLKVKESDKIEKYVSGLPDMIHRSVMASKPKTMQDAIEFATELMDKKIRTFAERQ
ncbi:hypothetical protein Tco_1441462, partial [Tanacetum coccineum]